MFSQDGYQAVRTAAGAAVRTDRGIVAIRGADRLSWLQGLLTNDVANLPDGQSRYAAYLTPQGRMITDMHVVALPERVLLDVPAEVAGPLRERLDSLIFAEDVTAEDQSMALAVVELHGPGAMRVIGRALLSGGDQGHPAVVRDDRLGLPGYAIYVDRRAVEGILDRLTDAGATPVSLETLGVIRVEAGVPAFGSDMDEETIPLEAGIEDRAVSFTKGCYVGQEVIVRVTTRGGGRVARRLVGLAFGEGDAVQPGDVLAAADGGRELGRVTSVAWSPALLRTIALGYVHRDFTEPGTAVTASDGERRLQGEVRPLPFVG
ncbi:MAG: folate-binding protein YgfZ [Vicinamibacterales bacterium]